MWPIEPFAARGSATESNANGGGPVLRPSTSHSPPKVWPMTTKARLAPIAFHAEFRSKRMAPAPASVAVGRSRPIPRSFRAANSLSAWKREIAKPITTLGERPRNLAHRCRFHLRPSSAACAGVPRQDRSRRPSASVTPSAVAMRRSRGRTSAPPAWSESSRGIFTRCDLAVRASPRWRSWPRSR